MESMTLPLPARVPAGPPAPLPPPAPLAMSEQSLPGSTGRRRHRLPGEPGALARVFLFVGAILLTAVLVHQMWLVLSIGGLTGVEKAMLGLFVINIAWIGFGRSRR